MTTTTIKWGVLSTSRHAGRSVIPAMHQSASGEAFAVASRDAQRAAEYAREHQIARSYGSYEALLADPDVDAVYIPVPNHMHKEWAIRAAEAGKHVLCEKPLGLDAAEAEAIVSACADAGVTLAEAFQWRHHPQAQLIRQLVNSGTVGDLQLIKTGFSFFLDRDGDIRRAKEKGGGSLYDVGCYPISFARFITGAEPVSVTAQAQWGKTGVDEVVVATLEFENGVMASINCGFKQPLRRYYEAVGTTGSLVANRTYNLKLEAPGEVLQYGSDFELVQTHPVGLHDSYTLLVEDFNRALLDNRPPLFPGEDAIANMRVIDAVYAAVRSGKREDVAR